MFKVIPLSLELESGGFTGSDEPCEERIVDLVRWVSGCVVETSGARLAFPYGRFGAVLTSKDRSPDRISRRRVQKLRHDIVQVMRRVIAG